jgi:hypothetical protein
MAKEIKVGATIAKIFSPKNVTIIRDVNSSPYFLYDLYVIYLELRNPVMYDKNK